MAKAVFDKEIIAATAADESVGYVDLPFRAGRVTVYVLTGAGVSAGTVKVEQAPNKDYTGTWDEVASISTAAANTCYVAHSGDLHGALRVRFDTAITGGDVSVHAIATED